jgi:hypothetical protein
MTTAQPRRWAQILAKCGHKLVRLLRRSRLEETQRITRRRIFDRMRQLPKAAASATPRLAQHVSNAVYDFRTTAK